MEEILVCSKRVLWLRVFCLYLHERGCLYVQAELGYRSAAASLYKQVAVRNPQNWAAIQGHLDCITPSGSTEAAAGAAANGVANLSSLSIANGSSANERMNGSAPAIISDNFQVCLSLA